MPDLVFTIEYYPAEIREGSARFRRLEPFPCICPTATDLYSKPIHLVGYC